MFARGVAKRTLRPLRARPAAQVGYQDRRQRHQQRMLSRGRRQEAADEAIPNLATGAKINARQLVFPRPANQTLSLYRGERYVASKQVGIIAGQQNELARTCAA